MFSFLGGGRGNTPSPFLSVVTNILVGNMLFCFFSDLKPVIVESTIVTPVGSILKLLVFQYHNILFVIILKMILL